MSAARQNLALARVLLVRRPGQKAGILIVDDDRDLREMVAELLVAEGYHAIMAGSADEAMMRLERVVPDLIISDLMMPETDGVELLGRLAHDPRFSGIPTILLTAAGEKAALQAINEAGVAPALMMKPIHIGEFLALVSWSLDRASLHTSSERAVAAATFETPAPLAAGAEGERSRAD